MPFSLPLPKKLKVLWKIKIFDNEILEEPHVTILRKEEKWRYGLRRRGFLESEPDPAGVPQEIVDLIEVHYDELCRQWDLLFPTNPVASEDGDDGN